jgi:hypothetical protein
MEYKRSAYFVLNVWEEELSGGRVEWKGEILDVDSGQTRRFEDWPDLVDLIAGALGTDGRKDAYNALASRSE